MHLLYFKNLSFILLLKSLSFVYRTGINELRNLQYLPRLSEAREMMFEDRTRAHADHVGAGLDRMTSAAVGMPCFINYVCDFFTINFHYFEGVLKAVHCGEYYTQNRITKDVIAFQADNFPSLVEKLQLDLHEPPISQVLFNCVLMQIEFNFNSRTEINFTCNF